MRKLFTSLMLAGLLAVSMVGSALASGGMPAAHGTDGRGFGGAVSGLAQANPLALASHTSGGRF